MRLVLIIHYTDGCTYNCEDTNPIIYESPEAAILDLEALIKLNKGKFEDFIFAGVQLSASNFYDEEDQIDLPNIMTVDEWYAQCEKSLIKDEDNG